MSDIAVSASTAATMMAQAGIPDGDIIRELKRQRQVVPGYFDPISISRAIKRAAR